MGMGRGASSSLVGTAFALALLHASPASAFVRPSGAPGDGHVEGAPGTRLRRGRDVRFGRVPVAAQRAWAHLEAELGPTFASWDRATGVPSRILGGNLLVPGSVADPNVAEREAQRFLRAHLDLLAPGTDWRDFVLVSNHLGAGIRSVGFVQTVDGIPVVGGQLSVRFKGDRLSLVASEAVALRGVPVQSGTRVQDDASLSQAARAWVAADVAGTIDDIEVSADVVLFPIIDEVGVQGLRLTVPVTVEVRGPASRWTVWVDARTGEVVAREQTLRFADAQVQFRVPDRGPYGDRADRPAPLLSPFLVDGAETKTDLDGIVPLPDATADVEFSVAGDLVALTNKAGDPATFVQSVSGVAPVAPIVWDASADELVDAELTTYVHANGAKRYVEGIGSASDVDWLAEQLPAVVNWDDECNAYWNGESINFFVSSDKCENTGRLADVVHHEFGHGIHQKALIDGVGVMDVALSEGISDYLAATIVEDSGMGRGFFFDDAPIRELDPADMEWRWPEHRGEVHDEGRIIGGTLWDLRKAFIETFGEQEGIERTDLVWFEAPRRSSDIPSMYFETLLIDDDDGNLQNGTPNVCLITDVFTQHGLYQALIDFEPPALLPPSDDGHTVSVEIDNPFPACEVTSKALLEWQLRRQPDFAGQSPLVPAGTHYEGHLPKVRPGTVIQYKIRIEHSNGSVQALPFNFNDPWYETFVGEVEPIYCTDFESDPAKDGWTHGGEDDKDEWAWGVPTGAGGDPDRAASGAKVFGQDLGGPEGDGNGKYRANHHSWAKSPDIDVSEYEFVRLQYQRWLEVEDGVFDTATLMVNDEPAWTHYASPEQNSAANKHHRDDEWRFHDVDLSDYVVDGKIQLTFDLVSDGGLHMGGWTLDDVCVVGYVPVNTCGDAALELGEQCDDGNRKNGDGCSKHCTLEDEGGTDGGAMSGQDGDEGCACSTSGSTSPRVIPIGLGLLVLLGAARRRKR